MKRPSLVFGLVVFTLASLFFILKGSTLFVASLTAVAVFLFFIISKNKKVKDLIIIPTICVSVLFSSAVLFVQGISFEKACKYDGTACNVVGKVIEVGDGYYVIKTSSVNNEDAKAKLSFESEESYSVYDKIFLNNAVIIENTSTGELSEKIFLKAVSFTSQDKLGECDKDLYYYVLNFKEACLEKLSGYMHGDTFGIAAGMLFGGTDNVSDKSSDAFRKSGAAHLLAVSGLHTSLWCGLILNTLKLFKIKEKYANLSGIIILIFLCIISGFTPSVTRSAFMMGITLLGPLFKKRSDSINSLGFSAGCILIINPFVLLSPSFFLSFLATLGVVLSSRFNYALLPLLEKKKLPQLIKKLIQFVYASLLISLFSTLFTLPASVYYFGTVSIIAPVTNLLTLNIAYAAMVMTLISLAASFAPFTFLAELLFDATEFVLKALINIIKFTASFKFSSVSANPYFIYAGIALSVVFFLIFILYSKSKREKLFLKRFLAAVIPLPVIAALILSVIPLKSNTSFTVLGNTATPNIIIKSGTHYVVINVPEKLYGSDYTYLPKTNNDTLDLLAITHINKEQINTIEKINEAFYSERSLITGFVNDTLYKFKTDVFNTSEVSSNFTYTLNDSIKTRIFDTYGKNCAIIEFNEKIIVLSFSKHNNLKEIENEFGKINVLILSESIPDGYCTTVDTLIVCSDEETTIHKNDKLGYLYAESFYRTTSDDITLKF